MYSVFLCLRLCRLMISNHLSDDLTITICSPSNPITFDLTLHLMMLLTSLLRRWWLLTALLEQKKLQLTKSKRKNQALYEKLTKYEMYMYSSP